jgi:CubicO group peptidase (beta-lactamase class C family)
VAPGGERLLSHEFVEFVRTPAPAGQADERLGPTYGGLFWVMNGKIFPDAFAMLGSGGQIVAIVPSYDLVIVRLGHFSGGEISKAGVGRAMALLKAALPPI